MAVTQVVWGRGVGGPLPDPRPSLAHTSSWSPTSIFLCSSSAGEGEGPCGCVREGSVGGVRGGGEEQEWPGLQAAPWAKPGPAGHLGSCIPRRARPRLWEQAWPAMHRTAARALLPSLPDAEAAATCTATLPPTGKPQEGGCYGGETGPVADRPLVPSVLRAQGRAAIVGAILGHFPLLPPSPGGPGAARGSAVGGMPSVCHPQCPASPAVPSGSCLRVAWLGVSHTWLSSLQAQVLVPAPPTPT